MIASLERRGEVKVARRTYEPDRAGAGARGAARPGRRGGRRRRPRRRLDRGVHRPPAPPVWSSRSAARTPTRALRARARRQRQRRRRSGAASARASRQSGTRDSSSAQKRGEWSMMLEVADLVLDDVVEHRRGREQQPPVERHRAGGRARRPARALRRGSSGPCRRAGAGGRRVELGGDHLARLAAVPALERGRRVAAPGRAARRRAGARACGPAAGPASGARRRNGTVPGGRVELVARRGRATRRRRSIHGRSSTTARRRRALRARAAAAPPRPAGRDAR